jgi:hypothetical protein
MNPLRALVLLIFGIATLAACNHDRDRSDTMVDENQAIPADPAMPSDAMPPPPNDAAIPPAPGDMPPSPDTDQMPSPTEPGQPPPPNG